MTRSPASLSISTLSELSGVSSHVIRAWERRYGALTPERAVGGRRLYGHEDVVRLKLLRRLTEAGHAIGAVASLPNHEIEQLAHGSRDATVPTVSHEAMRAALLQAFVTFDGGEAARLLGRAQLAFTPIELMEQVLSPLLVTVGDAWARSELSIAEERAASTAIRAHLLATLRAMPEPVATNTVLCATLEGEQHDLGALFAAVAAASTGRRVVFLAGSLPPAQIVLAAGRARSNIVLVSIACLAPTDSTRQLRELRKALPKPTEIVIGGAGAAGVKLPDGVEREPDLTSLVARL